MYYEGRIMKKKDLGSNMELLFPVLNNAGLNMAMDTLYLFEFKGKQFALANDQSTCEGVMEVAIIDVEKNLQFESWTLGWATGNKVTSLFRMCEDHMNNKVKKGVKIDIDAMIRQEIPSWFRCGCCGNDFKSTMSEQRKFDQDEGYGICKDCSKYY